MDSESFLDLSDVEEAVPLPAVASPIRILSAPQLERAEYEFGTRHARISRPSSSHSSSSGTGQDLIDERMTSSDVEGDNAMTTPNRVGAIGRIFIENFLIHQTLDVRFTKRVTLVHGKNGSGKSSIFQALLFAFGLPAKAIRSGAANMSVLRRRPPDNPNTPIAELEATRVTVWLSNHGSEYERTAKGFKGPYVVIQRTISGATSITTTKVFDTLPSPNPIPVGTGHVVYTTPIELRQLLTSLAIYPSNSIHFMSQQTIKTFSVQSSYIRYEMVAEALSLKDRRAALDRINSLLESVKDREELAELSVGKRFRKIKELEEKVKNAEKIVEKQLEERLTTQLRDAYQVLRVGLKLRQQEAVCSAIVKQIEREQADAEEAEKEVKQSKEALIQYHTDIASAQKEAEDLRRESITLETRLRDMLSERERVEGERLSLQTDAREKTDFLRRLGLEEKHQSALIAKLRLRIESLESEIQRLDGRREAVSEKAEAFRQDRKMRLQREEEARREEDKRQEELLGVVNRCRMCKDRLQQAQQRLKRAEEANRQTEEENREQEELFKQRQIKRKEEEERMRERQRLQQKEQEEEERRKEQEFKRMKEEENDRRLRQQRYIEQQLQLQQQQEREREKNEEDIYRQFKQYILSFPLIEKPIFMADYLPPYCNDPIIIFLHEQAYTVFVSSYDDAKILLNSAVSAYPQLRVTTIVKSPPVDTSIIDIPASIEYSKTIEDLFLGTLKDDKLVEAQEALSVPNRKRLLVEFIDHKALPVYIMNLFAMFTPITTHISPLMNLSQYYVAETGGRSYCVEGVLFSFKGAVVGSPLGLVYNPELDVAAKRRAAALRNSLNIANIMNMANTRALPSIAPAAVTPSPRREFTQSQIPVVAVREVFQPRPLINPAQLAEEIAAASVALQAAEERRAVLEEKGRELGRRPPSDVGQTQAGANYDAEEGAKALKELEWVTMRLGVLRSKHGIKERTLRDEEQGMERLKEEVLETQSSLEVTKEELNRFEETFFKIYGKDGMDLFLSRQRDIEQELKVKVGECTEKQRRVANLQREASELARKVGSLEGTLRTIEARVTGYLIPQRDKTQRETEKRAAQFSGAIGSFAERWSNGDFEKVIEASENPHEARGVINGTEVSLPHSITSEELFQHVTGAEPERTTKQLMEDAAELGTNSGVGRSHDSPSDSSEDCFSIISKRLDALSDRVSHLRTTIERLVREYGDPEELRQQLAMMRETFENLSSNLSVLKTNTNALQQSYKRRERLFDACRRCLTTEFTTMLKTHGSKMGLLAMNIEFDHEKETLDIRFRSDAASHRINEYGDECERARATATLSGGEGSFLSMCILLTCWRLINPPIIIVDEWDVFLDSVRRKTIVQSMLDGLHSSNSSIILISPNRVTEEEKGDRPWVDEQHVRKVANA